MAYQLSYIQERLYTYRAHVFQPLADNNADGTTTVTFLRTTGIDPVPCFRDEKSNVYTSLEVGRAEGESRRDFDEWFLPEGFVINDGYYIKDVTSGSSTFGFYWICRGAPSSIPKDPNGIRDAGQVNIQTSIVWPNELPDGVKNG